MIEGSSSTATIARWLVFSEAIDAQVGPIDGSPVREERHFAPGRPGGLHHARQVSGTLWENLLHRSRKHKRNQHQRVSGTGRRRDCGIGESCGLRSLVFACRVDLEPQKPQEIRDGDVIRAGRTVIAITLQEE